MNCNVTLARPRPRRGVLVPGFAPAEASEMTRLGEPAAQRRAQALATRSEALVVKASVDQMPTNPPHVPVKAGPVAYS